MKISNNLYTNSTAAVIGRNIENPITNFAQNCLKHIVDIWKWELSTSERAAATRINKLESGDVELKTYQIAIDREYEKASKERLKQIVKPTHAKTAVKILAFIPAVMATVAFTALLILSVIPAVILRGTLQNYKARITYIKPQNNEVKEGEKVSVMTWNLGLSEAELMNQINHLKPSRDRAPLQARKIVDEGATFIGLQEAFDSQTVSDHIINPLAQNGYYTTYAARPKFMHGLNSGLLIASKYPLKDLEFKPLERLEGADQYANKGILIGRVSIGGKTIVIANTHLNAGFSGDQFEKRAKRMDQMNQARTFIENYYKKHGGDQVIFLGDLNVSRLASDFFSAYPDYQIDAMTQLSKKIGEDSIVFKELTKNVEQPPPLIDDQLQPINQPIDPKWNESGEILGTDIDVSALNFQFVIEDIALKAKSKGVNGTHSEIMTQVKEALSGRQINNEHIKEAIDESLKNTPKKAKTLDHILLSESNQPYLSTEGHSYSIESYLGPKGYLSDHAAVVVELNKV